ncbi:type II toxin-antitoxin system VapC family toxin [Spirosoma koreense]
MGKRYIVDTNAISKALQGSLPEKGLIFLSDIMDEETNYSVITRMELLSYKPTDPDSEAKIQSFLNAGREFSLTEAVIQQTIAIRRSVRIKLPDAIIAGTAIVNNLILLSDNDSDFLRVPKLKYINPAKLT